jgi:Leucine-rich repeat (LRR) protein
LRLSGNHCELPAWIGELTQLERLTIGYNYKLRRLPDSLENLQKLRFFSWSDETKLSGGFPMVITKLSNLVELELGWHDGLELCDEIGQLEHLERLNLEASSISSLPDGFYRCSKLSWLNLEGCRLQHPPSEKLAKLVNLRTLYLRHSRWDNEQARAEIRRLLPHCELPERSD